MPISADQAQQVAVQAGKTTANQQQTYADQRKQVNNGDWRVKLSLAPNSNYLYNDGSPGILQPLKVTNGVIFPYTPTINVEYSANYQQQDLPHSNYKGYYYQSSNSGAIGLTALFTAQDTAEANYVLAVIHFFRSVTKMFYGQDAQRGAPPPLVYLTGLGQYQFNNHPCVVQRFTYGLPADVDYIRAGSPDNVGLNLSQQRDKSFSSTSSLFAGAQRLVNVFLPKGAVPNNPKVAPTLGLNNPTYVPTKIEMQISLLPMQTRQQMSQQFSLKEFANGNLLKGGFW